MGYIIAQKRKNANKRKICYNKSKKGSVFMYNEEKKKTKKFEKNSHGIWSCFFRKRTKRLLTNIDRLFTKIMWYEIGVTSLLIIFGIIFLFFPGVSNKVLGILFGLNILLFGAINIYGYIKRREIPLFKYHLIYGVIGTILGIITILNPFIFSQTITLFIGIWILYMAITKIEFSIQLKKMKESSWLPILGSGVLEIFMSILIFINPFSNLIITRLSGAYFILCGIINCADAVLTKNRAIDFLEKL